MTGPDHWHSTGPILAHLQAEDTFDASVPVFTYQGADIIEKRCEVLGWPNVTHTGDLMYENAYSADRSQVVRWAKQNAQLKVKHLGEEIARVQEQLADLKSRLSSAREQAERLQADNPDCASKVSN